MRVNINPQKYTHTARYVQKKRRNTMTNRNNTTISGYITNLGKYNEGYLIGEWINFPITDEELDEVLKRS